MDGVVCKCGYHGYQMITYETTTPSKQLVEWAYGGSGYYNHKEYLTQGTKTINWACPKCNAVLVQQRGGISYDQHEITEMKNRLYTNSWDNERWLKFQQNKNIIKETKINNKIKRHINEIEKLKKELEK